MDHPAADTLKILDVAVKAFEEESNGALTVDQAIAELAKLRTGAGVH